MKIDLLIDGRPHAVDTDELASADIREVEPGVYSVLLNGRSYEVKMEPAAEGYYAGVNGRRYAIQVRDPRRRSARNSLQVSGRQKIASPMPGKVLRLLARPGDEVAAGQGLLVVEAMKMQNEIRSPKSGRVVSLFVSEGAAVSGGETLAEVE
jgi:biotin carboxyl carrier protein